MFCDVSIVVTVVFTCNSFLSSDDGVTHSNLVVTFDSLTMDLVSKIMVFAAVCNANVRSGLARANPNLTFRVCPATVIGLSGDNIFGSVFSFVFCFYLNALTISSTFSVVRNISATISSGFNFGGGGAALTVYIVYNVVSLMFMDNTKLTFLSVISG